MHYPDVKGVLCAGLSFYYKITEDTIQYHTFFLFFSYLSNAQ